jgi:hypothetical protein
MQDGEGETVHTCISVHGCVFVCMHVYVYVCMCVCVCVCVCVPASDAAVPLWPLSCCRRSNTERLLTYNALSQVLGHCLMHYLIRWLIHGLMHCLMHFLKH